MRCIDEYIHWGTRWAKWAKWAWRYFIFYFIAKVRRPLGIPSERGKSTRRRRFLRFFATLFLQEMKNFYVIFSCVSFLLLYIYFLYFFQLPGPAAKIDYG